MDFLPLLISALQTDYLMILLQLGNVNTLQIPFEKELYDSIKQTTNSLKLNVEFVESNTPNFMLMEFQSDTDQDKFIQAMSLFNQKIRPLSGIPIPDIYNGNGEIKHDLVDRYLKNIKQFFATSYAGEVLIPIKSNADMPDFEQLFCACNSSEVIGVIIQR